MSINTRDTERERERERQRKGGRERERRRGEERGGEAGGDSEAWRHLTGTVPETDGVTNLLSHVRPGALALHILWRPLLFHTFPFYVCSPCPSSQRLLKISQAVGPAGLWSALYPFISFDLGSPLSFSFPKTLTQIRSHEHMVTIIISITGNLKSWLAAREPRLEVSGALDFLEDYGSTCSQKRPVFWRLLYQVCTDSHLGSR